MLDVIRRTAALSLVATSLASAQRHDTPSFTVGAVTAQRGTTATGSIPVNATMESSCTVTMTAGSNRFLRGVGHRTRV